MNAELETWFRLHNPENQQAYKDGFNFCKEILLKDIDDLKKKIEKLEAFSTSTSTSTNYLI
jgi:hypothetical protein